MLLKLQPTPGNAPNLEKPQAPKLKTHRVNKIRAIKRVHETLQFQGPALVCWGGLEAKISCCFASTTVDGSPADMIWRYVGRVRINDCSKKSESDITQGERDVTAG